MNNINSHNDTSLFPWVSNKLAKKVSHLLQISTFAAMTALAKPVYADSVVNSGGKQVSQSQIPDISERMSDLEFSVEQTNTIMLMQWFSNLYRKSVAGTVQQRDLIDFYNTYIITSKKSFPSIVEHMRWELLSLFEGMLENGYTIEWSDDLYGIGDNSHAFVSIFESLQKTENSISYHTNMPKDPNFTKTIIITWDRDTIRQADKSADISKIDTIKLKNNLEQVFAGVLDAIMKDMTLEHKHASRKYLDIKQESGIVKSLLRKMQTTNNQHIAKIEKLEKDIVKLREQASDSKQQADTHMQELREQKDRELQKVVNQKDSEISQRDDIIWQLTNEKWALSTDIESLWSAIPKDLLAEIDPESNLSQVVTTLISTLYEISQNEKEMMRKQHRGIIENKDTEIIALTREVKWLTREAETLSSQLGVLPAKLEQSQDTISGLEWQVQTLSDQNTSLQEKVAELEKELNKSQLQAQEAKNALAELIVSD